MDTTQPLLPNLISIDWLIIEERNLWLLSRMMTKSLISIVLDVWAMPHGLQQFISSIAPTCPALRKLTIHASDDLLCDSVSQTFCHLHQLTTLHCGTLDAESLDYLSRVPSLEELKFVLQQDVVFRGELLFHNLQTLDVFAPKILSAVDIVSRMQNRLTNFSISSRDYAGASVLAQLFRCLSDSLSHRSLRRLRIADACPPPHHIFTPFSALTLRDLHPLLTFNHLTHIFFAVGCGISLDDVAALELAQAWPNVVQLVLNRDLQNPVPSSMTPVGLVYLLRHCTNLTELILEVDFSPIEEQDVHYHHWTGDISPQHLLTFHVTFSRIHNVERVAAFLSDVLPQTVHVEYGWIHGFPDQREYAEKWAEVSNLLHVDRSGRHTI